MISTRLGGYFASQLLERRPSCRSRAARRPSPRSCRRCRAARSAAPPPRAAPDRLGRLRGSASPPCGRRARGRRRRRPARRGRRAGRTRSAISALRRAPRSMRCIPAPRRDGGVAPVRFLVCCRRTTSGRTSRGWSTRSRPCAQPSADRRRARDRRLLARRHRRARRRAGRHAAVAARAAPPGQGGARPRLPRRLPLGARARLRLRARDGLRLLARPARASRAAATAARGGADLVLGSRYVRGRRRRRTGASCAAHHLARRLPLRAPRCWALRGARPDGRLQVLPTARVLEAIELDDGRRRRATRSRSR